MVAGCAPGVHITQNLAKKITGFKINATKTSYGTPILFQKKGNKSPKLCRLSKIE